MCGICGMAGPGTDRSLVNKMVEVLRHRGPDGGGLWSAAGVALGHTRLKIIDLSDAGRQPMRTPDGRFTIVYNGEVYNYRELRDQFKDVVFHSATDTEVLLAAYARWGADCLARLVGMFSFALWDERERVLFCARDRLGIKPFYYALMDGNFFFASEIKALLAAGLPREANARVLYDFLARDYYEHTDETFFKGIRKLPPACFLTVRDGRPDSPRQYWSLASEAARIRPSADPPEREEELFRRMESAVDLHLRSDVPVGVALSGGLDSAMLLAHLDRVHPDPQKVEAFSFCFREPQYSEQPFVTAMTKHTGRRAHFVEVTPRMFAETARRICAEQEEPFAGAPISAYALCFQMARRHGFTVIMDGSGLDEGLAGYARFQPALWADLAAAGRLEDLEKEWAASDIRSDEARRKARRQMEEAAGACGDTGKGQDLTLSVRADCLAPGFAESAGCTVPEFERPFPDHLRNLMYRELRHTKLPRALRFRDRLSMAVSAELRPPFLDHRLLAYEFALPAEDRIHEGRSKTILRRAARRLLPDAVRLASKRSVQTPQREWFRGPLGDWVREQLEGSGFWRRGWVDPSRGRAAMESFLDGEGDNSFFLWQWINLEIWCQTFLDPAA